MAQPDAWLRGPVPGVDPLLMPAAHALIQTGEDCMKAAAGLTTTELWTKPPGGGATIGFHLRHIAGVINRLLTYARGEPLTLEQLAAAKAESEPGDPPPSADELLRQLAAAIASGLEELRATRPEAITAARAVGRAALPTTVLGLLFHAAEHAQRHAGQIVTTAKIVRSVQSGSGRA